MEDNQRTSLLDNLTISTEKVSSPLLTLLKIIIFVYYASKQAMIKIIIYNSKKDRHILKFVTYKSYLIYTSIKL